MRPRCGCQSGRLGEGNRAVTDVTACWRGQREGRPRVRKGCPCRSDSACGLPSPNQIVRIPVHCCDPKPQAFLELPEFHTSNTPPAPAVFRDRAESESSAATRFRVRAAVRAGCPSRLSERTTGWLFEPPVAVEAVTEPGAPRPRALTPSPFRVGSESDESGSEKERGMTFAKRNNTKNPNRAM